MRGAALAVALGATACSNGDVAAWAPSLPAADGLVTNSFAHWNPGKGVDSAAWIVTSGSLFASGGRGGTGPIDDGSPDRTSSNATGSAVFRMVSRPDDFADVDLRVTVSLAQLRATASTPRQDWDGVHLFVRYQSAERTYTVDLCRRDGTLTIKRKSGAEVSSAYRTLGSARAACPFDVPLEFRLVVRDQGGAVRFQLWRDGASILTAEDHGEGAPPILGPGRVGVRADNAEFSFTGFRATRL